MTLLRPARHFPSVLLVIVALLLDGPALAQPSDCDLSSANTHDYRAAAMGLGAAPYLRAAEKAHLTPQVLNLIHGQTTTYPGGDLEYVLLRFPNHPRALVAMTRLFERTPTRRPQTVSMDIECFYARALQFFADDTVVRTMFADYLARQGQQPRALQQLAFATKYAGDNPMSHYNIGLVYLQMKEFDLALSQAHRAAALGDDRDGLKRALVQAGKWAQPEAPAASAVSAASAASAASSASPTPPGSAASAQPVR